MLFKNDNFFKWREIGRKNISIKIQDLGSKIWGGEFITHI